jgi:hypothetical protein
LESGKTKEKAWLSSRKEAMDESAAEDKLPETQSKGAEPKVSVREMQAGVEATQQAICLLGG